MDNNRRWNQHRRHQQVPIFTLFAHISPHALQRVLGPSGPRRIIGVLFSLTPQCRQLPQKYQENITVKFLDEPKATVR